MSRLDLLSLSEDDLLAVSNRLSLKRAKKELNAGELTAEIEVDDAGGLVIRWSDAITCAFPEGSGILGGACTCPARKVCRHRVRSILHLQAQAASEAEPASDSAPPYRVDLGSFGEEELIAASNKLSLKRAKKELDAGALTAEVEVDDEGGLTLRWSDGITCAFPASGGTAASTCTCPARSFCRHRVRSILHLQALWEAQGADASLDEALADWSPADFTDAELRKAVGAATWRKAVKALAQGLDVEGEEGSFAVSIPLLGARVRFVPGATLEAAFCSCGSILACEHRVIAALSFRDAAPTPRDSVRAVEKERDARERALALTGELLAVGLDGAPPQVAETLEALALRARSFELPGPARDLSRLAQLLRGYHQRSARFSPRDVMWTAGRLGLRLRALEDPPPGRGRVLRGEARRGYLEAESVDVLCVGAEGFEGASGSFVRVHFIELGTGAMLSAGVGRPASANMDPAALWRWATVWGELTPRALMRGAWRLHRPRRTVSGRLASGGKTRAQRLASGEVRAERLSQGRLIQRPDDLIRLWRRQAPPILRGFEQSSQLVLLEVERLERPAFDPITQSLSVHAPLSQGGWATLRVRHSEASDALIRVLERVDTWRTRPTHVLARCRPSPEGILGAPISVWLDGDDGPRTLAFEDPSGRAVKQAAPPPAASGAVDVGGDEAEEEDVGTDSEEEDDDPRDPVLRVLQRATRQLEGVVMSGLLRAGAWRAQELRQIARRLDALELRDGARLFGSLSLRIDRLPHRLDAVDDAPLLEDFLRALLWTTTLSEGWQLERMKMLYATSS